MVWYSTGDLLMMRITILVITLFLLLTENCSAMKFQQPVKIGKISGTPERSIYAGVEIEGATEHKGVLNPNRRKNSQNPNYKNYLKGIARFEDLYFYYNFEYMFQCEKKTHILSKSDEVKISRFGSKNLRNTFPLNIISGTNDIYQIKNDAGLSLYMLVDEEIIVNEAPTFVIGTTKDGKWVKYFDTHDATRNYGINVKNTFCRERYTNGDGINFVYEIDKDDKRITHSILKYQWDDVAQWFGVERIPCIEIWYDMQKNRANYYTCDGGGTGLSFWLDKNSIKATRYAQKKYQIDLNIIALSYQPTLQTYPKFHISTTPRHYRYRYDDSLHNIFVEKSDGNGNIVWEYIDPSKPGRDNYNNLQTGEIAFYLAYGENFYKTPITYRGKPQPTYNN